jgi:hypothetical protein
MFVVVVVFAVVFCKVAMVVVVIVKFLWETADPRGFHDESGNREGFSLRMCGKQVAAHRTQHEEEELYMYRIINNQ